MAKKPFFIYDQLDNFTFVQTTSGDTVQAFDASVDDIEDDTDTETDVLNLGAASPNYLGQSVYITPVKDTNDEGIDDSSDATVLLIAKLYDGASTSPSEERGRATQIVAQETLEIPLPEDVKQYIMVGVRSDGGAGSAHIDAGAVEVYIGPSGMKG
jgi:hypothetical protein